MSDDDWIYIYFFFSSKSVGLPPYFINPNSLIWASSGWYFLFRSLTTFFVQAGGGGRARPSRKLYKRRKPCLQKPASTPLHPPRTSRRTTSARDRTVTEGIGESLQRGGGCGGGEKKGRRGEGGGEGQGKKYGGLWRNERFCYGVVISSFAFVFSSKRSLSGTHPAGGGVKSFYGTDAML